jgi:hypothetical protein
LQRYGGYAPLLQICRVISEKPSVQIDRCHPIIPQLYPFSARNSLMRIAPGAGIAPKTMTAERHKSLAANAGQWRTSRLIIPIVFRIGPIKTQKAAKNQRKRAKSGKSNFFSFFLKDFGKSHVFMFKQRR